MTPLDQAFKEKLASLCHDQWSGWMKYLFSKGVFQKDGTWVMLKWAVDRWTQQMKIKYKDLSNKEKDSDREEADRFIAIINQGNDTFFDPREKCKYELFNYWTEKPNLIKHSKQTKAMQKAEISVLKDYSMKDLKECIDNYSKILGGSGKYWYCYKHTFESFFRAGTMKAPPYTKFLAESKPLENFMNKDKKTNAISDQAHDSQKRQERREMDRVDIVDPKDVPEFREVVSKLRNKMDMGKQL